MQHEGELIILVHLLKKENKELVAEVNLPQTKLCQKASFWTKHININVKELFC